MRSYKTVEEIASEWNISTRHVQNLCKQGKIEGAVKRVGAWFIPDDMPIPLKNTKSDVQEFKFVGTKMKVFESAIELFMLYGFENVNIKSIADSVGVRQSAIYNHFKSKQEILDTIYDFYCHYFLADRPTMEELEPVLRTGSLVNIIRCNSYEFNMEYQQKLLDITKIVVHRNSIDKRAREINKSLILDEGIRFVETIFDRAVEIGRLATLDTHAMAVFINSVRLYTLYVWVIDPTPESMMRVVEEERTQYEYAARLLTDINPPGKQ